MHESRLVAELVDEAVRIAGLNDSEKVREMRVSIGAEEETAAQALRKMVERHEANGELAQSNTRMRLK